MATRTLKWSVGLLGLVLGGGLAWGAAVDAEIAEKVARDQVARFFPGEEWTVLDRVDVKGGEGETAAWGVVFANGEFQGSVAERLAAGEDGMDGESGLYVETATVVTGGQDTDSLVFRTFRGLADWYQEGTKDGWRGEAVRVGAGDIRYAAPAPAGARGGGKLAALKKAAAARKAAVAAEREALPKDLQEAAAEADAEAAAAAKARWDAAASQVRQAQRKAAIRAAE